MNDPSSTTAPEAGQRTEVRQAIRDLRVRWELAELRRELSETQTRHANVAADLRRVRELRWTRLGERLRIERAPFPEQGTTPSVESDSPSSSGGTSIDGDSRVANEVAGLRQQLDIATTELATARLHLERLYASRWTDLGRQVRRAVRFPRAARRHPFASAGRRELAPELDAVREQFERGDFEVCLAHTSLALDARPQSVPLRELRTSTLVRLGELTAALDDARVLAGMTDTPNHHALASTIAGRLRELDPLWLPELGAAAPLSNPDAGVVLHVLKETRPFFERGYTMRSHYALQAQRAAGLRPHVVTSLGFPRLDGFTDFDDVAVIDGIPHHRLDLGPYYSYRRVANDRYLTDYARQASRVVTAVRPAVIHANSGYRGFETALVSLALGRRFRIPVVYDVRSFLEATWTPDRDRAETGEHYRRRLERELSCMRQADLVFTIAETMRDEIVRRGIAADKVVVIPNAVDAADFAPLPPDNELRSQLGFLGRTVLGYVSNIGRREGLDVLVEALGELVRRGRTDIACLIVGDGPELAEVRSLVSRRGLDSFVRTVGHVAHDDVRRYYSIIDLFVIPRRDDQAARLVTPLKPFEAMAMARPLLVADLPALTEVTGHGERGSAFTTEDPVALANEAERLVDDPARRSALGRAGREWVSSERSWEQNGRRYVEAYARLVPALVR